MNYKILTIILVMVIATITNLSAQYFSRTYQIEKNSTKSSYFSYGWPTNGNHIISLNRFICPNEEGCIGIKHLTTDGEVEFENIKDYIQGNRTTMKLRNDTIFYSGRSINAVDSIYYWYFGMMTIHGDSISEYKYPMIHFDDGNVTNYGIVLTGGSEAILWGEGLDNRHPNPTGVPYRSVFLRVGFDGSVRSDLIWYERNDFPERRMSDAATDIDGNPVFGYFCIDGAVRRYIIKLMPDNSVTREVSISIARSSLDNPRIAVDHEGNYLINSNFNGRDSIWDTDRRFTTHVSKIDRQGDILWSTMMPQIKKQGWTSLDKFEMMRMTVTKDNDILCSGLVEIRDTFYKPITNEPFLWTTFASFIARLSPDGKVKWRHVIAPFKSDGLHLESFVLDIQEAPDGSIIVAGQLQRDTSGWFGDAWLMRLSADGCLNDACDHLEKYWHFPSSIVATSNLDINKLSFYPNPGRDFIQVTKDEQMQFPVRYEVLDIKGQRLELGTSIDQDNFQIEAGWLSKGMYLILIMDKTGKVWQGKWIKG